MYVCVYDSGYSEVPFFTLVCPCYLCHSKCFKHLHYVPLINCAVGTLDYLYPVSKMNSYQALSSCRFLKQISEYYRAVLWVNVCMKNRNVKRKKWTGSLEHVSFGVICGCVASGGYLFWTSLGHPNPHFIRSTREPWSSFSAQCLMGCEIDIMMHKKSTQRFYIAT